MAEKRKRLYIAYGSNLNLEQMKRRCPTAKTVGTTDMQGYELLFRRGVANVEPSAESSVPILVWDIKPRDEAALDRYEGFPHLYVKQDIEIELNGETVTAMAYIMAPGFGAEMPNAWYLDTIFQGYKAAGFDKSALEASIDRTCELRAEEQRQEQSVEQSQSGMKWGW
jgi:gamma-glutamylcyclotransferase (GGCT)/AIG2-like uncharacterized protein YtfP